MTSFPRLFVLEAKYSVMPGNFEFKKCFFEIGPFNKPLALFFSLDLNLI